MTRRATSTSAGHSGPITQLARKSGFPPGASQEAEMPESADSILQLLASILVSKLGTAGKPAGQPQPMLTVAETAALLGISRMTVIRKADAGELPCLVVIAGPRKKIRRFPRRFVEELMLAKGRSLSIEEFTTIWLRPSSGAIRCHTEPE